MHIRLILFTCIAAYSLNCMSQNIHRTACDGNLNRLDSLLQHEKLDIKDKRGRSLLHWAVGCNQTEIFNYLIEQGIEVNKKDDDGYTSLYIAVQFKRDTLFDKLVLLQNNSDWKIKQGAALLERAILDQNLPLVQKIIGNGVNIEILNDRRSSPLELSQRLGADEISKWLISNGADESKIRTFAMKGTYMGQSLPGINKKVFAPNFISTEEYEYGSVFN